MKTLVLDAPGKWRWIEEELPEPQMGKALVRVHRIGICGTDIHAFGGTQPFFTYPCILGHELGVEVLEVAGDDSSIRQGDRCAVEPAVNDQDSPASRLGKPNCCENLSLFGIHHDGGFRSHLCVPTRKLHKSEFLDFDQLSLIETLCIGAHAVERAEVTKEDAVLVIGAGPIGLAVIQSAYATGANVTVMDLSDGRLEFVEENVGIRKTLKPGGANTAEALKELNDGKLPSVILDATGSKHSMESTFSLAAHGARIVLVGLFQGNMSFEDPVFHKKEITLIASRNALPQTFSSVIKLVESGKIDTKPWITHRLKFADLDKTFEDTIKNPSLIKAIIEMD